MPKHFPVFLAESSDNVNGRWKKYPFPLAMSPDCRTFVNVYLNYYSPLTKKTMKKYLIMCVALLMGAVCLTSCSDDDDEKTILYHETNELLGGGSVEITIYETPKMLKRIAEWKMPAETRLEKIIRVTPSKDEETYIFDKNDLCTKATRTTTFRSEEDAQMMYNHMTFDLDEDGKRDFSIKGKVINEDLTKYNRSAPKDEIRDYLINSSEL